MFKKYLEKNEENLNIIYVNYYLEEYDDLKTNIALNDYVKRNYIEGKNNYILIDEVQLCDKFELSINNFYAQKKYDIYVTGSNAFLQSSDLATLFTGRTYTIHVYPFSFKEFIKYYEYDDINDAFEKYRFEGGLAGSYLYNTIDKKYNYVKEVYKTMILRDIVQKNKIRNVEILEELADFMIDNIGNQTSSRSITKTLNSDKQKIDHKTVGKYMKYLCNAYLFYKIKRYDIQGKKYLKSNNKYYLSDHSFKYAVLGTKNLDVGHLYENIVAIELLRRGYEIFVGVLYNKEIDFVAIKRDEKIYIQVSDNITDEKTFEREVLPLMQIKDAYPKILIARTKETTYSYEGIQIIDISNWLNMED